MTVLPVSMYQTVQQLPANLNFQLQQQPANQTVEIPMVTNAGGDTTATLQGEDNSGLDVKQETCLEEGSGDDNGQLNIQDSDATSPSELQILP